MCFSSKKLQNIYMLKNLIQNLKIKIRAWCDHVLFPTLLMCKILVSCEISGVQRNLAKHDSEIIRVVCCMEEEYLMQ